MSVRAATKLYRSRRKKKVSVGAVDHVEPVVLPATGFVDWNTYVARMFIDRTKLQWLCNECHATKTRLESAERKAFRATKK